MASRIAQLSKQILNKKSAYSFATAGKLSSQKINQFLSASYMIPHPEKAFKGGEDACFCNNQMLCVADGVGGWAQYGVDPGLYSKELVKHIEENFKNKQSEYLLNPQQLIIDSHGQTKATGSTTCCILTIDEQKPIVYTSYIGDSGYAIFRKQKKSINPIFVSEEQTKSFNFPYQIGSEGDSPTKAWTFDHQIEHNDIIVCGTDGVFDNIDENQILNCIKPFWEYNDNITDVNLLSEIIAKYAFKLSVDPVYNSPFAKRAKKAYYNYRGGKSDDITVVVAQVKLLSEQKHQEEKNE
ncbi:hypothetical protein ABPG72_010468 [Tetrahymena utriculariae]